MPAVPAHEQAGVLSSGILATAHFPLLLELTAWTRVVGPRELLGHALSLTPELSGSSNRVAIGLSA